MGRTNSTSANRLKADTERLGCGLCLFDQSICRNPVNLQDIPFCGRIPKFPKTGSGSVTDPLPKNLTGLDRPIPCHACTSSTSSFAPVISQAISFISKATAGTGPLNRKALWPAR